MMSAFLLMLALWILILVALLLVAALRPGRGAADRALTLELLSASFCAALALVAGLRRQTFFLDVALAVALVGLVETVAITRWLRGVDRRETE